MGINEFELVKNKSPIEIIKDYKNIFLNPFIHYMVMESPLDFPILDYKKIENAYLVLIKIIMEYVDSFEITFNMLNFEEAKNKELINPFKKKRNMWKIKTEKFKGYGFSLPEAICKLAISYKFKVDI